MKETLLIYDMAMAKPIPAVLCCVSGVESLVVRDQRNANAHLNSTMHSDLETIF